MPKVSNKKYRSTIETEIRKWHGKSRQMKTLSHVAYGKIKCALIGMEKTTQTKEMLEFRREIGNIYYKLLFIFF